MQHIKSKFAQLYNRKWSFTIMGKFRYDKWRIQWNSWHFGSKTDWLFICWIYVVTFKIEGTNQRPITILTNFFHKYQGVDFAYPLGTSDVHLISNRPRLVAPDFNVYRKIFDIYSWIGIFVSVFLAFVMLIFYNNNVNILDILKTFLFLEMSASSRLHVKRYIKQYQKHICIIYN